ncbi:transglutaminase-like cysteine peptidase [Roseovarius marisflavi]|nr:transglutaminase-like cysteine peptidase [Roseovarius marisflavi]
MREQMSCDGAEAFMTLSLRQCGTTISVKTQVAPHQKFSLSSSLIREFKKKFSRSLFAVTSTLFFLLLSPAYAGGTSGPFLVAKSAISAPAGFSGLCSKYTWLCASTAKARMSDGALLRLATAVNTKVNRQTRAIADRVQYGREEHWALPTARGGDCEDFALLKKKTLIEHGVSSTNLLIATVLDRRLQSHAVLVLRTSNGDFVLDNLNKDIRPWKRTGYTFLKLQNPEALGTWHAVLAGGIITERPTASK